METAATQRHSPQRACRKVLSEWSDNGKRDCLFVSDGGFQPRIGSATEFQIRQQLSRLFLKR